MKSKQVRQIFLNFFNTKKHKIVSSAPIVNKNDPTLMFTNAGMNQFKDIFLGNKEIKYKRIANSQKCLRVSGKHNDLEEVGIDTYHHTMFEMLGNWSFGDYFKKEAIEWAWELLTKNYKIDEKSLYITVFGGDDSEGLKKDIEAYNYWKAIIPEDRILFGSKKDNFWEMGETGPCGYCSEIHIDIRSAEDKKKIPGKNLINKGHPEVIEIWNLVFIEYDRKSNKELLDLPDKHIDTGMGFERLCMVLQGVRSTYDTDIFQPLIQKIANIANINYGSDKKTDIAIRVIADHIRAVAFAIADGQLPSNTGAGYVIRRILRRAIRYGYTFLKLEHAFIYELTITLSEHLGEAFPEIKKQENLIQKIIKEEEQSFLKTLTVGIVKFEQYLKKNKPDIIDGHFAFELFDTYGFPIDLTGLMAQENGLKVDIDAFNQELLMQKDRSKNAAQKDIGDWVILNKDVKKNKFTGYKHLSEKSEIIKYRQVKTNKKDFYEIVLDKTPFYAESGGQVGDTGFFYVGQEKIRIIDTKKDSDLIIHISENFPKFSSKKIIAEIDIVNRKKIKNNHTATHLLHAALRKILGIHVEQKGSLVDANRLRFDFFHYAKLSFDEIKEIENIVNKKIRENISLQEFNDILMDEAKKMGAIALFGEKYGDKVRVIQFDENFSVELCGGTHVDNTGEIGLFKIISENAIAAGIRRIEALTGEKALEFYEGNMNQLNNISNLLKNPINIHKTIEQLLAENNTLKKQIQVYKKEQIKTIKKQLIHSAKDIDGIKLIYAKVDIDMDNIRDLAFTLNHEVENLVLLLGSENNEKANLSLFISQNLVKTKKLNAGIIIREIAKDINGSGGGQPHYATAGGSNIHGIEKALKKIKDFI